MSKKRVVQELTDYASAQTKPIGRRPLCQTNPICRSRRVRRATRVKQTQLAHAWIAAPAVRERSPARLDGLCIRTNEANWVGSRKAIVQNKANCRGAQMGDNSLRHKRLQWFWPACSRWRTKPICPGRRGARHPVSLGREPKCRRAKQSQLGGSHRAKQSQFAGRARCAVACLPSGGRRTARCGPFTCLRGRAMNTAMSNAHEKAVEFLEHQKAFRLGELLTESSHPKTRRLSQTMQTDVQAGVRLLQSVDEDIPAALERIFAQDSFTRLVEASARRSARAGGSSSPAAGPRAGSVSSGSRLAAVLARDESCGEGVPPL